MNMLNEKSAAKPKLYKHSNKINHEEVEHYGDNCEVCASIIDAALSMALDNLQHMLMVDRKKAEDILCDRVSEW